MMNARTAAVVLVLVGLATGACKDDEQGAGRDADGDAGAAAEVDRCPLTAEQVSAAVGAELDGPDSTCSFYPADEDKVLPNVAYVHQVSFACSGNTPAENDYTEAFPGLSVTAYVRDGFEGTWLLVCRSGAPFEVRVDTSSAEAARAAAKTLAEQVLAAE